MLDEVTGGNVNVEALSVMVLYDEAREYEPIATTISMEPKEALIEVGDSLAINYVVRDQNGAAMANVNIDWMSSEESVARVTDGRITAIADGQATITATIGEVSESMVIRVETKVPETIEIIGSDYVYVGSSKQLQAKVLDQLGQDFTTIKVNWESSDTSVATVNSSGKIIGIKPGYVVITATAGNINTSLEIEVRESIDRYIEFKYIRKNNDYTDWSLWLWQSGKSDGDLVFDEVTDEYAIARFPISAESENVGFVLHKTINDDPWAEKDAWGADRFIKTDLTQSLTKVTVLEGIEKIAAASR